MNEQSSQRLKLDWARRAWTPRERREAVRYEFDRGGMPVAKVAEHFGVKDPHLASSFQRQRTERGAIESSSMVAEL